MLDIPGSGAPAPLVGVAFGAVFVEPLGICGAIPETG
jgi:hypothetical protein